MAVTSRDLSAMRRLRLPLAVQNLRTWLYIISAVLALVALYLVLSFLVGWGRTFVDDIRYGSPRTYHLTADVGHGGGSGAPSHFIAVNLDRQVVVLDIPAGDTSKVRPLPGPYLFGEGEDMTPVTLAVQDVNADGITDLVMKVKNEEIVYVNRDGEFHLPSAEERQQMMQQGRAQ